MDAVAPKSAGTESSREATPRRCCSSWIKKVESIDPALAANGRVALLALTGEEPAPRRAGKWRHGRVVARYVKKLVPRDRDSQVVTEIGNRLIRLASRLMKPRTLTPKQTAKIWKMAAGQLNRAKSLGSCSPGVQASPERAIRHLQHRQIDLCFWR